MKRGWAILFFGFLLASMPARAQFYSAGNDPGAVRWSQIRTDHYRVIYPSGIDSLARAYALSLQRQYPRIGRSIGFMPSELCTKPMPVILHPFTPYANGMVMWAPRRMDLYTVGDASDPDPMPWLLDLTTHEPRHASQLQLGRRAPFKVLRWVIGDLSDVAWWSLYTGIAFSEGDAVVAETGLTQFGRGRTADFLEYVRVAFDEGDWRDFYRWRYGSQRLYTPDHYRAGYMLAAGLRTVWNEPLFLNKYHDNLWARKLPLPFFNMPYTVRQVTGLSFKDAFRAISEDFQAVWAANDAWRGGAFVDDTPLTPEPRRFTAFRGAEAVGDDIYAVETGLERAARLVRIDAGGTVTALGPFSSTSSDLRYSPATGLLYWSEEVRDPRWALAGTSILRAMDLSSGRKQTLVRGGRLYNPAPSEDGACLASVEYAVDGSHRIRLTDARSGAPIQDLEAPAGLQPAQLAWIGDRIFASAVTDEGFGIYEASAGWRPVLPGRPVKVKQLRARNGRLWFVCDKDGVNELYSCDPETGALLRHTRLRHGGTSFLWNAAGDSLRYTVLSTGGRRFHTAPVSAFSTVESDWDQIWKNPVAEELSAQEQALEAAALRNGAAGDTAITVSAPRPYRKVAHLLRFHSWAPLYIDYDAVSSLSLSSLYSAAGLGATAFFQNDLATAAGSLAYRASRNADKAWEHLLDLRFNYTGLYPVFETTLALGSTTPSRYQFTHLTETTGGELAQISAIRRKGPSVNFSAKVYVPLSFNWGGWNRGLVPQIRYTVGNSLFDGSVFQAERYGLFPDKDKSVFLTDIEPGESVLLQNLSASIRGYAILPKAPSGVYPRWGIGAELGGGFRPALTHIYDPAAYGYLYGYVPGLIPEHGLRLTALTQMQWSRGIAAGEVRPAAYIQEQRVTTSPRGYAAVSSALGRYIATRYPFQTKLTADYLMAILPLDWSGLGPVAYVKNFELGLHGDAAFYGTGARDLTRASEGLLPGTASLMSAGASLSVRLGNLLWVPFDTRIGIDWSCNFGPSFDAFRASGLKLERHYFGLLFSVDY